MESGDESSVFRQVNGCSSRDNLANSGNRFAGRQPIRRMAIVTEFEAV